MRFVFLFFALSACAQSSHPASHPAWWTYAPPEATALVGVRWEALRESPLAGAVEAELSSGETPIFELECLKQSSQLLLASPEFLAIAYGDFPPAKVRAEAAAKGFKRIWYKGVEVWVAPPQAAMSVAPLNGQLML